MRRRITNTIIKIKPFKARFDRFGVQVVSIGGETNLAGISRQDPRTAITSITLTQDGEYLCMSLKNHICQLWRVGPILRRMMKRENTTGVITSSPYGLPTDGEKTSLVEPIIQKKDTVYN